MSLALFALFGIVAGANAAGIVEYGLKADSPVLGRPIPYAAYKPFPHPAEGERWPVVYLLHGLTGKDRDWFTWGNLGPILDQAIADGRIPPLIVVAPGFGDSWYVDNPDPGGYGRVDTALATDLVHAVDYRFPTAACRFGRAVGGLSMGGAGAVLQGLNHPDTYVAVMSLSGALHQPLAQDDPRLRWIPSLYRNVFGDPFDRERFNAANAFNRVGKLRMASQRPAFYLTIGDQDYPDLIEASALFHNKLRELGIDTTLRIGKGGHFWDTWQQAIIPALEWLAPKLDRTCAR
ncbi:alpha/beta hydrolase family protein [Mesorhizobium sp. BAC0120]|uniref:alpha/beta hydrolase n=1 Tax=Mesorhizobium sp. BAC0120 TaxID=3090670 RepID=UPI00298D1FD8|nr:alpha/beta hydrolase family protein [Mesorhizobium sp. BAC0120]MDW6023801.1 alpha/beta hydrolase family protein [Mesorhizobium sp. BAC0120]